MPMDCVSVAALQIPVTNIFGIWVMMLQTLYLQLSKDKFVLILGPEIFT